MRSELTWWKVCQDIREMVRVDSDTSNVDLDDPDSWDEYAHEWADGSEWVIYYHNARTLWADSSEVQAWEDDARDTAADSSIDSQITACVYLAVRAEIMEALREVAEERNLIA
jgi:hypothetical protein